MSKTPLTCPPSVWRRLCAIRNKRMAAKNRESELVQHRKVLEEELDQLGFTRSAERSKICVDYVDTLRSIDYERSRIKQLADKSDQAIETGIQGGLFDSDDDLDEVEEKQPPAPLYEQKAADEDGKPPVGEAKPEEPAPAAAPSPDPDAPTWHGFKLTTLAIEAKSLTALRDAGLLTLGDVVRFQTENAGRCRLTKLGVTAKDEHLIEGNIRQCRDGTPLAEREPPKKRGRPKKAD